MTVTLELALFDDEGRTQHVSAVWAISAADLHTLQQNWVALLRQHKYSRPVWMLNPLTGEVQIIWLSGMGGDGDAALARARMHGEETLLRAVRGWS